MKPSEVTRTPYTNSKGEQVYDIMTSSTGIPPDEFTDLLIPVQTEIGFDVAPILSIGILHHLYDLSNQTICLKMIEEIILMSTEKEYQQYRRFFECIIIQF